MSICFFAVPAAANQAAHIATQRNENGVYSVKPKRKSEVYARIEDTRHTHRLKRKSAIERLYTKDETRT